MCPLQHVINVLGGGTSCCSSLPPSRISSDEHPPAMTAKSLKIDHPIHRGVEDTNAGLSAKRIDAMKALAQRDQLWNRSVG